MLIRIVKLTFKEEHIATFKAIFEEHKKQIRNSEGCSLVELYQDSANASVFFTYSYWNHAADLEAYRKSSFFTSVWSKTKVLFSDKPKAWSVNRLHSLP